MHWSSDPARLELSSSNWSREKNYYEFKFGADLYLKSTEWAKWGTFWRKLRARGVKSWMITLKKSNWRQIQYNLLCILCIVTAHNLPINCCSLIGASLLLVVPLSELRTLGARVSQELDGGEDSSSWRDGTRTEWSSLGAENVFWWKQERKVWRREISSRRCWDNSCQYWLWQ